MDSIIETQRATHEEIDRYEQALADVLMQQPVAQRNITRRDRKAAEILSKISELRQNLVAQYEDAPGLRPRELALLSAPAEGQEDLSEFYSRFEKVKDFHKHNTNINARTFLNEIDDLVRNDGMITTYIEGEDEPVITDPLDSIFSGEEAYGKRMDLYQAHTMYLNLRGANRLSYVAFLDMLRRGYVERTLDTKERSSNAYLEYVQALYTYLLSFYDRALPLEDLQGKIKEEEENFALAWEAGQVTAWQSDVPAQREGPTEGIWCEYCQKTYSKQTVYDAHLSSGKHKKKVAAGVKVSDPSSSTTTSKQSSSSKDKLKPHARITYLVGSLLTHPPIPEILANSRSEVERRMALTAREREAEMEEQEEAPPVIEPIRVGGAQDDGDESDDDPAVYNPLNLPLGWDGKPIPYWLYKLHGLGVTFSCEICAGASYQGRKAFDRHFTEARHAYGMRALGLPNTKHFHEITKIADALALAEKLKFEGRAELAAMDRAEEMEDDEGTVYDKRTYMDLKKQGVI